MDPISQKTVLSSLFNFSSFDIAQIEKTLTTFADEMSSDIGEGKLLFGMFNENFSIEDPPIFHDHKSLIDFYKSEGANEENTTIYPLIANLNEADPKIFIDPHLKHVVQRNGLVINQNGQQTKLSPHQITVIALTPGQLQRINMAVSLAFENLKSDDKKESNLISGKKFTILTNQKPLVAQEKFPLLKSEDESSTEATERKKDHQQELKLGKKTALEKYKHDEKVKDQRKASIKKRHIITKTDVTKSTRQAENRKIDISKEFLK